MKVFSSLSAYKAHRETLRDNVTPITVGFVPTMGALHDGHGSLIAKSASENNETIVSIFVNPKQFGPSEDYAKYPRTFEADKILAQQYGASILLAPSVSEIYPDNFAIAVRLTNMTEMLCGLNRPGHFDGVCTIVLMLLNIVDCHRAYFGLKDFQQFSIVRKLCKDLWHRTQIVGVPTMRAPDGLALSSRNVFLTPESRSKATFLYQSLQASVAAFSNDGIRDPIELTQIASDILSKNGINCDYLDLRNAEDLSLCAGPLVAPAVLAIAAKFASTSGTTRLIDNVMLSESYQPTKQGY